MFQDGSRREGTFKNGKEDGLSIHKFPDGSLEKRVYKDDEIISKEKIK